MMWQAKLKAWAVGLGLTVVAAGGTGYLATTGVGQGPGPGPGPVTEKSAARAAELPSVPAAKGDPEDIESLQFDIDRAKLQIQRAEIAIEHDKQVTEGKVTVRSKSELDAASSAGLQAKEDKLVAERNLKLAERKLAAVKGQPVAAVTPMTAEVRKLREQRLEALTATSKGLVLNFQEGLNSFESNLTLSIELSQQIAEAEAGLAAAGAPRTGPWEAHRERAKALRVLTERGVKDGFLTKVSIRQAQAAELAAEIRLLELGGK